MNDDGTCPKCDAVVDAQTDEVVAEKAPWHFKLMIVALVAYLGWRVVALFM